MTNEQITGIILLILSGITFTAGIMWLIAWFNQLAKFCMKIYQSEATKLEPQYCIIPPIFLGVWFIFWRVAEFLLTFE